MNETNSLRYLLHVSDFHLTEDIQAGKHADAALDALVSKLQASNIQIDYLVHTGDVIDSSDIFYTVATENPEYIEYTKTVEDENGKPECLFDADRFSKEASLDEKRAFDALVNKRMIARFSEAEQLLRGFISRLNIAPGNTAICCGNHDVLRPFSVDIADVQCKRINNDSWKYSCPSQVEEAFDPFEDFLNNLNVANSQKRCNTSKPVSHCMIGNLNILILNTNWMNHGKQKAGYYCIRCEQAISVLKQLISEKEQKRDTLNIVLAHKPLYEICENPRLPYRRYIETPFMSNLKKYVGDNGLYLCGDKHTRSIAHSQIHAIRHYIGGEPLRVPLKKETSEVEYNLLEVSNYRIGIERKIHLRSSKATVWTCEIRPQDSVVDNLYRICSDYISKSALDIINRDRSFRTWDDICQEIHNWSRGKTKKWNNDLNILYKSICKYRKYGTDDISLTSDEIDIFDFIVKRINEQMKNVAFRNILNIRGEYDSGKSTFLSIFYIYLLNQYSVGAIDYIPAYYNLESNTMNALIDEHSSYNKTAQEGFRSFAGEIQDISEKEHQRVCYIIDGQDEQDCWSYSSEDSIGRGILDVLAEYKNSWYIMSYSQHRLPYFKNTMPMRKYNDTSDIMYFNPVDVRDSNSTDCRFKDFVGSFLTLVGSLPESTRKLHGKSTHYGSESESNNVYNTIINDACAIIRRFRRLTINPGFMYQNLQYIAPANVQKALSYQASISAEDVYSYYIDRQEMICMNEFGYGFVNYAPAMAYLFAFKGYTYERFKKLTQEAGYGSNLHIYEPINANRDKVYQAFLFIKKHSDAREYLIAMHYNRELRFYAENPNLDIAEDSILNEFITRNVSVIIRKLWTDTNKFIIVCDKLLQRENLSNCVQSTLIYCLAYMRMYNPIRDSLGKRLRQKAKETLQKQYKGCELHKIPWEVTGDDYSIRLKNFLNLSLLHTLLIYSSENSKSTLNFANALTLSLEKEIADDYISKNLGTCDAEGFRRYNRQIQRLYYGDLFIRGEANQRLLDPCDDRVDKGFDFHNCYNYLLVKLYSGESYSLKEFDLFTAVDLITTRRDRKYIRQHHVPSITEADTFFFKESVGDKAENIINDIKSILTFLLKQARKRENKAEYVEFIKRLCKRIK